MVVRIIPTCYIPNLFFFFFLNTLSFCRGKEEEKWWTYQCTPLSVCLTTVNLLHIIIFIYIYITNRICIMNFFHRSILYYSIMVEFFKA